MKPFNLHGKAILIGILLFSLPLLGLLVMAQNASGDFIEHFWEHLAWEYLKNTLIVTSSVTFCSVLLGAAFAYLCVFFDFPGRRFLTILLALPMAFPAYILGYVYLQVFELHTLAFESKAFLAMVLGFEISVRGKLGLILSLSLAFYPYVFLLCRSYFFKVGRRWLLIGDTLGLSLGTTTRQVILPGSLPALSAGAVLVALESLADFGASHMFSVDTFTTGIFKSWFDFFSIESAAYLSLYLILFALPLVILEIFLLKHKSYPSEFSYPLARPLSLPGFLFLFGPAVFVVCLASALPLFYLFLGTWQEYRGTDLIERMMPVVRNTIFIGGVGAILILLLMTALAVWWRLPPRRTGQRLFNSLVYIGYGLPGAMIGVAMLGLLRLSNKVLERLFAEPWAAYGIAGMAVITLFWAFAIRFAAAIWKILQNAMLVLSPTLDLAAQAHGRGRWFLFWQLYLPHLKHFLFFGFAILAIEIIKEMPLTLLLRPVGWDTLVVKIFEYTSEGEWRKAMLPALLVACVGMIGFLMSLYFGQKDADDLKRG